MRHPSHSETPATRLLKKYGVAYQEHFYDYVERGGAERGAQELGVPGGEVVKTLVMEDERGAPLLVLMHGDRKVSTRNLARQAGRKHIEPCSTQVAQRHSGYQVGGTSPFGTRKAMPVYMERSILALPRIYVNGGRRGFLLSLAPAEVARVLAPQLVEVALAD
ncbi:MAG TPA: aminoacyl-tRNA deacylase [Burkholderiales bacterium]|nr:aminoacyl-tRNA deacylase [Burkholderiales bacterium]